MLEVFRANNFVLTDFRIGMKYFFVSKRWLNPKHCDDLKLLDAGWETLKGFCPAQDLSTFKAKFLLVCQQFHDAWEELQMQALASKSSEIGLHEYGCERAQDRDPSFLPPTSSTVCRIHNLNRRYESHRQNCDGPRFHYIPRGQLASECVSHKQNGSGTCPRTACEEDDNNQIHFFEMQTEWPEAEINDILSPASYGGQTEEHDIYFPRVQEFCDRDCQICTVNIMSNVKQFPTVTAGRLSEALADRRTDTRGTVVTE